MLGEGAFRRGEEQEPVFRSLRESERESERRHLLSRRGRRRFDKAESRPGVKRLKGLRPGQGGAGKGGIGDHGKS